MPGFTAIYVVTVNDAFVVKGKQCVNRRVLDAEHDSI